tara:strand:- start:2600 stop:3862 length:1263 start_codon:yes stop_codon:yes gene_type:complete
MSKDKKLETYSILIFILLSISLFIGFYFNEDGSGGGSKTDFLLTWPYIVNLKNDFFNYLRGWSNIHLPLHYIIISFFFKFLDSIDIIRLFFCLISLSLPILFYKCLRIKFEYIDKNYLLIFASSILLLPTFRYTAIWANVQITAQIFFLISLYYFLRWTKNNKKKIDKFLIYQTIFLALSVYTRQDYAIYYIFFIFYYFRTLNFIDFLKLIFFVLLLAFPGILFVYEQTSVVKYIKFTPKVQNFVLVNSSMLSFYLIPIFLTVIRKNLNFLKNDFRFLTYSFIFFSIIVILFAQNYNYDYKLGGGFILKLSLIIFNSNYLFYLSSVIGLTLLAYLSKSNLNNLFFIILLIFGYSADVVYQKYFEPIFIFSLFLIIKTNFLDEFLKDKKNIFLIYLFNIFYLISAIINQVFLFSRSINYPL